MPELIDRQAAIATLNEMQDKAATGIEDVTLYRAINVLRDMPTIEAEPVRHGRWIVHTTWHGMFGLIHSECSECKFDRNGDLSSWKFCPNCGARMDSDHIADASKKVGGSDNG